MTGISIVIPTWNGQKILEECLPSVRAAIGVFGGPVDVLVVDDGPTDDTAAFLGKNYPDIRYFALQRNYGYGYACNVGVRKSAHGLVVLLNNDVWLKEDFLKAIPAHFEQEDIFAVRMRILDFDDRARDLQEMPPAVWIRGEFKFGFIYVPSKKTCRLEESPRGPYAFNVSAGAFAFDKKKWDALGGFDDLFLPFYAEETDIAYRALKRGWKIVYEPRCVAYHRGSGFTIRRVKKNWYVTLIGERNRYFLVWKNMTDWSYLLRHIFFLPFRLLKNLLTGDAASFAAFFCALGRLGEVLERRRLEKREAQLTDKAVFDSFSFKKTLITYSKTMNVAKRRILPKG